MALKALDPRVNRLGIPEKWEQPMSQRKELDQFETYEVFVQVKEGKDFGHEGIVHAPNEEMAFLFAKEQYTRRGMFCNSICVVKTEKVKVTDFTDDARNIYDTVSQKPSDEGVETFEIFHLLKRGKQHKHVGSVLANDYDDALAHAKQDFAGGKPVLNVWVVKTSDLLFTDEETRDIWDTLKEKQYREAIDYRAADKIKAFKEKANQS